MFEGLTIKHTDEDETILSGTIVDQATIVTSVPSRTTLALPKGIASDGSGTGPRIAYSPRCSMKRTGSGSRIAVKRRPEAYAGSDGMTTLSPGTCVNQASKACDE